VFGFQSVLDIFGKSLKTVRLIIRIIMK
jgi:hypothetical protein